MLKARLEIKLPSRRYAEAIAKSVSPDNSNTPTGLKVETRAIGKSVVTHIRCKEMYETFIATIDDILTCIQTAQRSLEAV